MNIVENLNYSLPSLVLNSSSTVSQKSSAPSTFLERTYLPIYKDTTKIHFQLISNGFLDPYSTMVEFTIKFRGKGIYKVDNSFLNIFNRIKISVDGKDIEDFQNMDTILTILSDIQLDEDKRKKLKHLGFDQSYTDEDIYQGSGGYIHKNLNFDDEVVVRNGIPVSRFSVDKNFDKDFETLHLKIPLTSHIFGILNNKQDFIPLFLTKTVDIEIFINPYAFYSINKGLNMHSELDDTRVTELKTLFFEKLIILDYPLYKIFFKYFSVNDLLSMFVFFLDYFYTKNGIYYNEEEVEYNIIELTENDCLPTRMNIDINKNSIDLFTKEELEIIDGISYFLNWITKETIKNFEELKIEYANFSFKKLAQKIKKILDKILSLTAIIASTIFSREQTPSKFKENFKNDITDSENMVFLIDDDCKLITSQLFFEPAFHKTLEISTLTYKINTKFYDSQIYPCKNDGTPQDNLLFSMLYSSIDFIGFAFLKNINPFFVGIKNFRYSNNITSVQVFVDNLSFPEVPIKGRSICPYGSNSNINYLNSIRKAFSIRHDEFLGVINKENFAVQFDFQEDSEDITNMTNMLFLSKENCEVKGKSVYIISTRIAPEEINKLTGINTKKIGYINRKFTVDTNYSFKYKQSSLYEIAFCRYDVSIELNRDYPIIFN